jgi:hypothetical protein
MNDSQLENLLYEAGQMVAPPMPDDLAVQVRLKYFKRRKNILYGGSTAAIILGCLCIYSSSFILYPSSFPPPSPALALEERIERLNRKLDQLTVKIQEQDKELAQMVEYQKALDSNSPQMAEMTEYGMMIRQKIQAEQAGYMLVGLGEDYLAMSQPDQAAKNFKKVVESFPETATASKAKKLLAGIGK